LPLTSHHAAAFFDFARTLFQDRSGFSRPFCLSLTAQVVEIYVHEEPVPKSLQEVKNEARLPIQKSKTEKVPV